MKEDDQPLMTIRVSRDGGRTWSPTRRFLAGTAPPPLSSMAWPPCACARCRAEADGADGPTGWLRRAGDT